ncbi:putative ribonuclease H-like domain-containing protein [Senna tora]|uniref:Putative ribonuclease H-like domain-containing protein n=1 Tax=Senna tora TaxID=362788 RepID=A0A834W3I4_9FABA|nr:putative ribonuclease H-like domain-containing protein [Senna tora]
MPIQRSVNSFACDPSLQGNDRKSWRLTSLGVEDLHHLFFNYGIISKVWENMKIKPPNVLSFKNSGEWLKQNAMSDTVVNWGVQHGTMFVFWLWEIWLGRNALVFENKNFDPRDPKLIASGGIIRDCNGNWVHGFYKFIGAGNSIMAELWAILNSLKLAKHLLCTKILVETDSLTDVHLINNTNCSNLHHLSTLVCLCRAILSDFSEAKVLHVHREGNSCTDLMARQAFLNRSPLLYSDSMPSFLSSQFLADLVGINYSRNVRRESPN